MDPNMSSFTVKAQGQMLIESHSISLCPSAGASKDYNFPPVCTAVIKSNLIKSLEKTCHFLYHNNNFRQTQKNILPNSKSLINSFTCRDEPWFKRLILYGVTDFLPTGLTHWGLVMHMCIQELNHHCGLLLVLCQAIFLTSADQSSDRSSEPHFDEIFFEIQIFSLKEMQSKFSANFSILSQLLTA